MKKNPFLTIGLLGLLITVIINISMIFTADADVSSWWVFYIVWFVFLIIGIGQYFKQKKRNSN
ncbi:MAG TPA: hypothetical protein VH917_02645 [Ignavibacteriaceae bacterium]|jgi:hypothetical protein